MTRGTSGRRKKAVSYVEAVSNSRQKSGRGPDREALILTLAQLEIVKEGVCRSGPALPHSHIPLKGRYDTSYSLSGRIMRHSSY